MAKTPISVRLQNLLSKGYMLGYYPEATIDGNFVKAEWSIEDKNGNGIAEGDTLDECIGNARLALRKKGKNDAE